MRLSHIINEATLQMPRESYGHLLTPAVNALSQACRRSGHEIRIVGGAVRDLVLGYNPKDIDMATDATPQQMMEILDSVGIRHEPTGLQHGTITAIIDGDPIEITTLRVDSDHTGRHASVAFTKDWELDAERRDLTFNAMSLGLDGTLYDYFNGVQDLKNNIARFVGNPDQRIQEDYLRILRYFRFQGRLNKATWDTKTLDSIEQNRGGLKGISGERIWAEMSKIMSAPSVIPVLNTMNDVGVLDTIGLPTNRLNMLNQVDGNNPVVIMATLVNNIAGLATLRSKWKFGNAENAMAWFIISNRDYAFNENVAKIMIADPKIDSTYVIALAQSLGKSQLVKKLAAWKPPVFPVTGADLIAKGVKPGPELGKILQSMRQTWEENGFKPTKQDLMRTV